MDLLDLVIKRHGGLERLNSVDQIIIEAKTGGWGREQTFYFDESGLLRRHDYTAEVFGPWDHAAHYNWGHREFGGITIPAQRQVFPLKKYDTPLRLVTLVRIKISEIRITYG